jgi:hypothetical protein
MGVLTRVRARDRIAELARRGHDLVAFWEECTEVLVPTVPHVDKPCWYTLDPASLLITSHYHDGLPEFPPEVLHHEYYGDDVNQISDVVRSEAGISTLHEATGGDPASSPSWHMNMAMGGDQEMIVALRTGDAVWGAVGLYRAPGEPLFDDEEKAFLRAIGPDLARGARTGLLVGEARDPQWPDSPGLVVLSEDGRSSPPRPESSAGSPTSPTETWVLAGCRPPSMRWPAARCGRRRATTIRARSLSPVCSRARERGSSFTAPRSSPRVRGERR